MRLNHRAKNTARANDSNRKWLFLVIGSLIGTVFAVLLLFLAAMVIKNMSPDDGVLSIVSTVVKISGSFFAVNFAIRRSNIHPIVLGVAVSALYMFISCVLFIILSKSTPDLRTIAVDMVMSVVSGVLFSIILGKKSLFVKNK